MILPNVTLLLIITFFYEFNYVHSADSVIVNIDSGLVSGQSEQTIYNKKTYYSFKGIPYAKPPIKNLRYKPPQAPEPWNENIFNANKFGNECTQQVDLLKFGSPLNVTGSEDCLFINVYTPDISPNADLATIFFIHGGGYCEGSANAYGPDFLINQNIILVTLNYRLGPFGFLSLGTDEYSGNAGLKDQLFALKWVNRNIDKFGGNKNRITIAGHSAGAGSTHSQVLSSATSGLYQRAIVLSGAVVTKWGTCPYQDHTSLMYDFAKKINQSVANYDELVKFLIDIEPEILIENNIVKYFPTGLPTKAAGAILWSPVVEPKNAENIFFHDTPENILQNKAYNDIDIMFGVTSEEMLFLIAPEIANPNLLKPFDEQFQIQLPFKNLNLSFNSEEYKQISNEIRQLYFGKDARVDESTIIQYNELLNDIWFQFGIEKAIKGHLAITHKNTFLYLFSFVGELNAFKALSNMQEEYGASHGDDLCYIFKCGLPIFDYNTIKSDSNEMKVIQTMSQLFANFAKYGKQSTVNNDGTSELVEYQSIKSMKKIYYMDITNDGLFPRVNWRKKYMDFWNKLESRISKYIEPAKSTKQQNILSDEL